MVHSVVAVVGHCITWFMASALLSQQRFAKSEGVFSVCFVLHSHEEWDGLCRGRHRTLMVVTLEGRQETDG